MSLSTSSSFETSKDPTNAAGGHVLASAPHRIGRIALTVRDLDSTTAFYEQGLGLELLDRGRRHVLLGTGTSALVELRHDPQAGFRSPSEAGLFHIAFLLPDRADLAAFLAHAARQQVRLLGASDHAVSEAVYLADPEGNGIEIYIDRPSAGWAWADGKIDMPSEPLDLRDLASAAAGRNWSRFPIGGRVGHVHLQVGDIPAAETFYSSLGFDITSRYPGGTFFGSGGYHHQLAANVWNSRGASLRPDRTTGLADVEILVDAAVMEEARAKLPARALFTGQDPATLSLQDPWGTSVTLRRAA